MDLLGRIIQKGHYVAFVDGGTFRVGIVKGLGNNTAHIIGILKEAWYIDRIYKKRKHQFSCVILNLEQLDSHIRNSFLQNHPNGIRTKLDTTTDGGAIIDFTVDDFVESRIQMLHHLRRILGNNSLIENVTPNQRRQEALASILDKSGRYNLNELY